MTRPVFSKAEGIRPSTPEKQVFRYADIVGDGDGSKVAR